MYKDDVSHRASFARSSAVTLLDIEIDPITVPELHSYMAKAIRANDHVLIPNVNIHCLNLAYNDLRLRTFLQSSDLVFCDGAGIILGAKLTGQSIPERITYADWMWQLAEFAAGEDFSLYFVGARPGVGELAAQQLRQRFPKLRIVGIQHGYFNQQRDDPENQAVIAEINAVRPDILLVGLGMPRQEYWLDDNWDQLDVRVALTGGAVFDYISGQLRRGPSILTDHGFEWLARLLIEPSRLWQRYLIGNPLFLWRVLGQAAATRRRR